MDWHSGGYGPSGHPPASQHHQHAYGVTGQPSFPEQHTRYYSDPYILYLPGKAKRRRKRAGAGFSWFGYQKPSSMLICCLAASIAATVRPTISLNTGATMPAIGFGTYQLNGSELKEALLEAIASGSRLIDTAAGYENEHIVAEAIAESGIPREDFFLTTKLWCTDHGGEETFDAIMSSLAQLNTEYADLYLIHAPTNPDRRYAGDRAFARLRAGL